MWRMCVRWLVCIAVAVVATASETAITPSASELLELLDEWNLSVFRPAFQQKKIDGFALMVCSDSVHVHGLN